jgi:hypothetical protein
MNDFSKLSIAGRVATPADADWVRWDPDGMIQANHLLSVPTA